MPCVRPVSIVLLLLAITPLLIAPAPRGDEITFRTEPGGMPLRAFLRWVSDHVDGAISYAPPALALADGASAPIVVESPVTIAKARVIGFARSLLAGHDLTLVDVGSGVWLAERISQPTISRDRVRFVAVDDLAAHRDSPLVLSTIVRLAHTDVDSARRALTAGLPAGIDAKESVIAMPRINAIVVRATGHDAWAIGRMLATIDRPAAPVQPGLAARIDGLEKRVHTLESQPR